MVHTYVRSFTLFLSHKIPHSQNKDPEGLDFTIRTPGTPERFAQFEKELERVWEDLAQEGGKGDGKLDVEK